LQNLVDSQFELLNAVPDAVLLVRRDGTIAFTNGVAGELFGYTLSELLELQLEALVPGQSRARHVRHRDGFFSDPRVRPMGEGLELNGLRKDGTEFPVDIHLSTLATADGVLAICVVRDISRQKLVQLELEKALAEIGQLRDRLEAENIDLREKLGSTGVFKEIVGDSEPLKEVLNKVEHVAATDSTVLLLGETGTGKELIAQAIHTRSQRAQRPLVRVNCAALPGTLIESDLFGHEKGAFTGATDRRLGRFEMADGGTIFLDEIGDLAPELQSKLLRVLQSGEFERVGSGNTIKVDVRVVAATNRDLEDAMLHGSFRTDLYYRLNVFPITIPPLRQRKEDIPILAWFFVSKLEGRLGKKIRKIRRETMDALVAHDWPGNVRELEHAIERAMILSPASTLVVDQFSTPAAAGSTAPSEPSGHSLEQVERAHIIRTLEATGWRVKGKGNAAERLGLSESTLRYRMHKLGIIRPG